jgi:uncharacterized protein (DUF2236 family)
VSVEGGRVERADLEQELAALRAEVARPAHGLFGPDTTVWRVSREAILFLGAGRASLLQLAHPYVGVAVGRHSVTQTDPTLRFRRTFHHVFRMTFGPLEEALASAHAVFGTHRAIHGPLGEATPAFAAEHRYDALDRDAAIWVLATLWDTSLLVYERVVGPLTAAERERFYRESRRFARLFGVERALPPTWVDFQAYVRSMLDSPVLAVTSHARRTSDVILNPAGLPGRWLARDYGLFTAHLLPERLAAEFGLDRGGAPGAARVEALWNYARALHRVLPKRLRFVPAYVEATRRIEGRAGRDRLGEGLARLYVGR